MRGFPGVSLRIIVIIIIINKKVKQSSKTKYCIFQVLWTGLYVLLLLLVVVVMVVVVVGYTAMNKVR